MSLADRIAKIEAKLLAHGPGDEPAILITAGHGDTDQPYVVEHAGHTWTQRDGESSSELLRRAHADLAAMPRAERGLPDSRFPVLALVARRGARHSRELA